MPSVRIAGEPLIILSILLLTLAVQVWMCYLVVVRLVRIDRCLEPWRARAGVSEFSAAHVEGDLGAFHHLRGFGAVGTPFAQAAAALVPVGSKEREKLMRRLRAAGYSGSDALAFLLCSKLLCSVVFFLVLFMLLSHLGAPIFFIVFLSLGALAFGGLLPEYVLRALIARRNVVLSTSLCDALDLLVMGVETGSSPDHALAQVVRELSPVAPALCAELGQLEAELRIGADREQALTAFVRRCDVDGLRDLGIALIQGGRYGTPLSESLRNLAQSERRLHATRVAERIERLPVLLTLPMIALVVPGAAALIVGPAVLTALQSLGDLASGGTAIGDVELDVGD